MNDLTLLCDPLLVIVGQPDFEALKSDSRSYVRIGGCGFQQSTEEERKIFTTRGGCPFHAVLTQLFPNVQLNTITNEFMPAEKFSIDQFSYGSCSNGDNCKKDVKFELTGKESLEIRPQYFTLVSYSKATVSWTYNHAPTFQNVLLTYQGHSSLGKLHYYNSGACWDQQRPRETRVQCRISGVP